MTAHNSAIVSPGLPSISQGHHRWTALDRENAISLADEAKNKVEELKGRSDVGVTHGQARTGVIGRFAAPLPG